MSKLSLFLRAAALVVASRYAFAQQDAGTPDPTRTSDRINDLMRSQLAGLRSVTLKGSVVAGDTGGVALLDIPGSGRLLVRSRSQCTVPLGAVPLPMTVRDVTPAGVEIEAPTLQETVWLASTMGPVRPTVGGVSAAPTNSLRHVEFHEVALSEALRMLAEQGGGNYSPSPQAGSLPVSAFLRDVEVGDVIAELCKTYGLWFRPDAKTGILRILTMPEFERDLVSFREEQTEVFTLLYPNVLELASVIQSLYGERVLLTIGRDDILDESADLAQRFRRFDMIDQRGSSGGTGTAGGYGGTGWSGESAGYGGSTTVVAGNGTSVVRSDGSPQFRNLTPDQAERVQRSVDASAATNAVDPTVEALRTRPASILVTVSRRNNMIIVRTSDPAAMEDIRSLVRRMDVPTSMVLLEVKVLTVTLGDGFHSVFDYSFAAVGKANGQTGVFTGGFTDPTGQRAGDMTFQVVNEYFTARMQLLEEKNRVKILATPMLLTANNEVSRLFIGEERPIITGVTGDTVLTEGTSVTTPRTQWESREIGTTLLITPNINSDRTVTLRLVQEDSAVKTGAASIPVVLSDGAVQDVAIDVVASRVVSGTFVAKDQLAVAVGGLIEEQVTNVRAQVPLLGDIPWVGRLFRRETRETTRQETVIMIRPHVISTPSEGARISRDLLRDLAVDPAAAEARPSLELFKGERR